MHFSFHPDAKEEFFFSIEYYEEGRYGLGFEFVKEVFAAIDRISSFPKAWPSISLHTRRCLINRFPFGIIYRIENKEIIILAIMELHRMPGYWRKRVKE